MKPTFALCGVLAGSLLTPALQAADAPKATVLWPASDIKWADIPAAKGAKIAVLWGDPKTGPYGALKSLPAGTTLALHTHSLDQRVVMISGTVAFSLDGAPAKDLTAGSYAMVTGGAKHAATCKAGADCVYFEEQQGPADMKMVETKK